MKKKQQPKMMTKRRCDTIYIVEYTASENAKETALEKVKKLVLSETENLTKINAS